MTLEKFCKVDWDPLPETPPETPRTPPTHKEEETQTEQSALKANADRIAAELAATSALKAAQVGARVLQCVAVWCSVLHVL